MFLQIYHCFYSQLWNGLLRKKQWVWFRVVLRRKGTSNGELHLFWFLYSQVWLSKINVHGRTSIWASKSPTRRWIWINKHAGIESSILVSGWGNVCAAHALGRKQTETFAESDWLKGCSDQTCCIYMQNLSHCRIGFSVYHQYFHHTSSIFITPLRHSLPAVSFISFSGLDHQFVQHTSAELLRWSNIRTRLDKAPWSMQWWCWAAVPVFICQQQLSLVLTSGVAFWR